MTELIHTGPTDSDEINKRWAEEIEKLKGPDGKVTGPQAYKAALKALESMDDRNMRECNSRSDRAVTG